jgi:hypothetical protein
MTSQKIHMEFLSPLITHHILTVQKSTSIDFIAISTYLLSMSQSIFLPTRIPEGNTQ